MAHETLSLQHATMEDRSGKSALELQILTKRHADTKQSLGTLQERHNVLEIEYQDKVAELRDLNQEHKLLNTQHKIVSAEHEVLREELKSLTDSHDELVGKATQLNSLNNNTSLLESQYQHRFVFSSSFLSLSLSLSLSRCLCFSFISCIYRWLILYMF